MRIRPLLTLIQRLLVLGFVPLLAAEPGIPSPPQTNSIDVSLSSEIVDLTKPKISIVVDDLGDNSIIARKLAALPVNLTMAILPHTPYASKISQLAAQQGHEIIMHLPMEALTRPDLLGPGALFSDMSQQQFLTTFLESAHSIPGLVGFNNHMGSLLTQDGERMSWLMQQAQQNQWYFLDSKTIDGSVAQSEADKIGLPAIGRDIFLDHHQNLEQLPQILKKQLEKAKKIAKIRGNVVVICHPYQQTLNFLTAQLPELMEDFELVKLSELLPLQATRLAKAELANIKLAPSQTIIGQPTEGKAIQLKKIHSATPDTVKFHADLPRAAAW